MSAVLHVGQSRTLRSKALLQKASPVMSIRSYVSSSPKRGESWRESHGCQCLFCSQVSLHVWNKLLPRNPTSSLMWGGVPSSLTRVDRSTSPCRRSPRTLARELSNSHFTWGQSFRAQFRKLPPGFCARFWGHGAQRGRGPLPSHDSSPREVFSIY